MSNLEPTFHEHAPIKHPRLIHGLFAAARNGIRYAQDRILYELDPNPNATEPRKVPNFELQGWMDSTKEN